MKSPVHILCLEDDARDSAAVQPGLESTGATGAAARVHSRGDFVAAVEKIHQLNRELGQRNRERKRGKQKLRASRDELRALTARIQAAREEERTHAAREIHDVLAQELTALRMEVAWLGRTLAKPRGSWNQSAVQERVDAMDDLIEQASRSVQRIASDLRPVVLDSLGLYAAVEWVAADFQKRTNICCNARVPDGGPPLDRERSTALFRILQESLTNIGRHARASQVEIHLRQLANAVVLTICDNGRGIQSPELKDPRSLGLLGMRERASLLAGRCMIRPHAGGGTMVQVRLPISPPNGGP